MGLQVQSKYWTGLKGITVRGSMTQGNGLQIGKLILPFLGFIRKFHTRSLTFIANVLIFQTNSSCR